MMDRQFATRAEAGTDLSLLHVVVQPEYPSTLVVEIRGELDVATAPLLRQDLEPFLRFPTGDGDRPKIVYRLAHLTFVDAAGLDALLVSGDGFRPATVSIREASPEVKYLLATLGLENLIEADQTEFGRR